MKHTSLQEKINHSARTGEKLFAWLIDPDKFSREQFLASLERVGKSGVNFIFLGGSLIIENNISDCINVIRENCDIPVILFPGSPTQINGNADGILFLSLISGRNPDLLIGRHVEAAPLLKQTSLEVLPTGYMLIGNGNTTTASYISHTIPIPPNKPEIAAATAMAGEMLGLRFIYLDAGSGAEKPIPYEVIHAVKSSIKIPLIVGGGIRSRREMDEAYTAGADVVVVGNAIEKKAFLLEEFMSGR